MKVTDVPSNGERYGGVKDSLSNVWRIATYVKDSQDSLARRVCAARGSGWGKWKPQL
jgi:hypothetical protein